MSSHTTPTASPSADTDERLARAALSRAVEPDAPDIAAQVRRHGAAAVWDRLRREHPDVDPRRDIELIGQAGGRLVCPGDDEWPRALDHLHLPLGGGSGAEPGAPWALWVRGTARLATAAAQAVAVVGSRVSSSYGNHLAAELGFGLAERGWTVVSGAAFGIDAAAHRGALAVGGTAVAVLAGGADVPYPRAHAGLLDQIVRCGAVVSEAPPGSAPHRRRFFARSRLIAGLARGTVLVEAGHRSGALETARHARRLGRPTMACPGPVTSAVSAGCHRLLREHRAYTTLVTSAGEVLDEIGEYRSPVIPGGGRIVTVHVEHHLSLPDLAEVLCRWAATQPGADPPTSPGQALAIVRDTLAFDGEQWDRWREEICGERNPEDVIRTAYGWAAQFFGPMFGEREREQLASRLAMEVPGQAR